MSAGEEKTEFPAADLDLFVEDLLEQMVGEPWR
jgi:hypothetical protein